MAHRKDERLRTLYLTDQDAETMAASGPRTFAATVRALARMMRRNAALVDKVREEVAREREK